MEHKPETTIEKISESKWRFFMKINKLDKPLARRRKKWIYRDQLYANTLNYLDEMYTFFERQYQSQLK